MDWLMNQIQTRQEEQEYMAQQQQMNQEFVNQQLLQYGEKAAKTKKKDILNYMQSLSGAQVVEQVDEFETLNARHICYGSKKISILPKCTIQVPTSEGMLPVEYIFCQSCGTLWVNKSSLWSL